MATGKIAGNGLSEGVITKNTTSGTFEQYCCYKVGNVVNVSARIYNLSQVASGFFFTLPEGFRPRTKAYCSGTIFINNTATPATINIETNGSVGVNYSGTLTLTQISFVGTFPI